MKHRRKLKVGRLILLIVAGCLLIAAVIFGALSLSKKGEAPKTPASVTDQTEKPTDKTPEKQPEKVPEKKPDSGEKASYPVKENFNPQAADGLSGYQKLFPDLVVTSPAKKPAEPAVKTAYLTFDDGPSKITPQNLDTLDKYGIKATFFVTGNGDASYYKEIVRRGHTIALHTNTHDYKKIYASVEAFLEDYNKLFLSIKSETGVSPEIFRFPGGTVNNYNKKVYKDIAAEMTRRGFLYYDWNASSADSAKGTTVESVKGNILNATKKLDKAIILMHDAPDKQITATALPEVIDGLKAQGFVFDKLTQGVMPYSYY